MVELSLWDDHGHSALWRAMHLRDPNCVRQLARVGIVIDQLSENGDYPLGYAARNGHNDMITCLLDLGSKHLNGPRFCRSPLELAIMGHHHKTIRLLVDRGASIHAVNECGETLYMFAQVYGTKETLDLLVDLGYRRFPIVVPMPSHTGSPQLKLLALAATTQHKLRLH